MARLITPELLAAILAAVERDQHNESRADRLRDLLVEDRELIADMFAGADVGVARDAMRRLMLTPGVRRIDEALASGAHR